MEALYQMGKEMGALEARISALEAGRCRGDEERSGAAKPLPKAQKALLSEIKVKHSEIIDGFNDVLKKLKLSDRLKIGGINLVDVGVRLDDEEECCMCCHLDGQSGWQYCCDFQQCSTCCS